MADNTVWVPVLASMKGFIASVNKGAGQAAKSAGSALEQGLGAAGRKGGESAASQLAAAVETATNKVVAARHREVDAAGALGAAEQNLENLRKSGEASASEIMAAEAKIEDARRTQEVMSGRLSRAEEDLGAVRDGESGRSATVVGAENRLEDARLKAAKAADEARVKSVAYDEAKQRSAAATARVESAEASLEAVRSRGDATAKEIRTAESEVNKARKEADRASTAAARSEGALKTARSDSESKIDQVRAAEMRHKAALDDVDMASREAARGTDDLSDSMGGLGGNLKSGMGIGALAGVFSSLTSAATNSLGSLASEAITASDATDKFKSTMAFSGVDTSVIDEMTAKTQKYADDTVYELADIQSMTAQLASNGVDNYEALGEAAGNLNAVAGGNADTFKSVGMVMTQTAGAGKLTTENWNQLADAIPGASGKLQEALEKNGAYTGNFRDAMSDGQVTAEEFNQAVMELGSEPVAVEAAKSTATFEGMLGNLKATITGGIANALNELKPQIGAIVDGFSDLAGRVMPLVVSGFKTAAEWMSQNKGLMTVIAGAAAGVATGLLAIKTVQAGMWAVGAISMFAKTLVAMPALLAAQRAGTLQATAAQMGLNGALVANPIGAVIVAVMAVVGALALFFTKTETGRKAWAGFVDFLKGIWSWMKDTFAPIFSAIGDALSSMWDGVVEKAQPVLDFFGTVGGAVKELWGMLTGGELSGGWPNLADLIGVNAAETVFGVINRVRDALSSLWEMLKNVGEFAKGVWDILFKGDFTGLPFGLEEDSGFVDFLFNLRDAAISVGEFIKNSLVGAFNLLGTVVSTVWTGMKFAWENILKPAWDAMALAAQVLVGIVTTLLVAPFMIAWNLLSAAVQWAWENRIKPAWDNLGLAANFLWNNVLMPVFGWIKAGWDLLATGIQIAWTSYIKPAWDAISLAAQWLWTAVLMVIFTAIKTGWDLLVQGIVFAWSGILKPAWDAVGFAANWLWTSVLMPVFGWIKAGWDLMVQGVVNIWNMVLKPAWDAVGFAANFLWNSVLMPVFEFIKAGWNLVAQGISNVWNGVIKPAWDAFGSVIDFVVHSIVEPAFDSVKNALQRVGDFFQSVVNGIKSVWESLRSILAKPINFMIDTVYNRGILKAWNTIQGILPGLERGSELSMIPEHATGGAISGPGTGTSDDVLMWGSNGEHMWTANEVRKLGGQDAMYTMRSLVDRGETFTVAANGGIFVSGKDQDDNGPLVPVLPAYAEGGEVRPAWEHQLARGHEWAKAQSGKPYLTGNQFPAGADCSGYMSAIAGVIIADQPSQHWATPVFPSGQAERVSAAGQPWVGGLGQGFSIGMSGGPDSGGQNGHTAGTLSAVGNFSAVNVESGGSHGNIAYGGPAAGADDGQFPTQYHLAIGADGAFEPGGSGPSPEAMRDMISKKVSGIIDEIFDPIVSQLPAKPPEWQGIPKGVFDTGRDGIAKRSAEIITGLGDKLRTVWEGVKDIPGIGAVATGAGRVAGAVGRGLGEIFDTGGMLQSGRVGVNLSGKPERVLSPDQTAAFDELVRILPDVMSGNSQERAGDLMRQLMGPAAAAQWTVKDSDTVAAGTGTGSGAETTISGKAGALADEAVSGQVQDALGVFGIPDTLPSWMTAGQSQSTGTATTSATTADETASTLSGDSATEIAPAVKAESKPSIPDWGPEYFAYQIAKKAKDMGLASGAAKIAIATSLVETGDPMKMYANNAVPASLNFRHDAVGSDGTSVGLFQQTEGNGWGTVADRMDAYKSAGMFFKVMLDFFPDWQSRDPGAVAQGVQRSAYPDRYAGKMGRAQQLVDATGLYDQGGVLDHRKLALNLSGKPEAILTNEQWAGLSDIATTAAQFASPALATMANAAVPGSGALVSGVLDSLTPIVGSAVDAVDDALPEDWDELFGGFDPTGGDGPAVGGPTDVDDPSTGSSGSSSQSAGDGSGGPTVIYQVVVGTKAEAYETVKKFQAREYAGFGVTR